MEGNHSTSHCCECRVALVSTKLPAVQRLLQPATSPRCYWKQRNNTQRTTPCAADACDTSSNNNKSSQQHQQISSCLHKAKLNKGKKSCMAVRFHVPSEQQQQRGAQDDNTSRSTTTTATTATVSAASGQQQQQHSLSSLPQRQAFGMG